MACFFFDLDGTLLNSNREVLPSTITAIRELEANGHVVAINTGRSYLGTRAIMEQCAIDYAIVDGGITIYHHDEMIVYECLDPDFVQRLFNECTAKNFPIVLANDTVARVRDDNYRQNILADHPWLQFEYIHQETIFDDVKKIFMFVDEKVAGTIEALQDFNYLYMPATKGIVTDQNFKYRGVEKLVAYCNLQEETTIGFGDSGNDVEMLQKCDIGVAMANGNESAKKVSDLITDSNDNDGIFKALHKLGYLG